MFALTVSMLERSVRGEMKQFCSMCLSEDLTNYVNVSYQPMGQSRKRLCDRQSSATGLELHFVSMVTVSNCSLGTQKTRGH